MPDRQPPDRCPAGSEATCDERFDEHLSVPWWWWPLGLGVAALLAAEVHMGYSGIRAWLPYVLIIPLVGVVLAVMGRHRVTLRDGELRVGPANIAVHELGQPEVIHANAKRRALGPELDPAAFVLHAGWVGPVVRVTVTDPRDPTPYWIFSVRQADKLAALLHRDTGEVPPDNSRDSSGPRFPGR